MWLWIDICHNAVLAVCEATQVTILLLLTTTPCPHTHLWTEVTAIAPQNTQIKKLASLPLILVIMCSQIYWIQLHI